jgi:hypothetical protein
VEHPEQMTIEFGVWDQEANRSDDFVGSATISFDGQSGALRQREWLKLCASRACAFPRPCYFQASHNLAAIRHAE